MRSLLVLLLAASSAIALAAPNEKRQDLSALLGLASEAGIHLPTDPAALLSLYPLATALASYLPTQPVLSALETAAPPGFLSKIVHDPAYAASFEAAFAAGSSPSWFVALPTEVRSYLHTYQGYGGLATAIAGVESGVAQAASASASASVAAAAVSTATATAVVTVGVTGSGSGSGTLTGSSSAGSGSASSGTARSSSLAAGGSAASASASASASTSTSTAAAAARETGMLAAAGVGIAAVLGLAAAL